MIKLARTLGIGLGLAAAAGCSAEKELEGATALDVEPVATIGGEAAELRGTPPLEMPAYLRLDGGNRIWTLDTGRKAAVAFGPDGRTAMVAGREGGGPGELRVTMAIDVAPDGSVWILDVGSAKAVRFVNGAPEAEFRLEGPPGGIVAVDDEVWIAGDLFRSVFMRHSAAGEFLGLVGTPVDTGRSAYRTNQGVAARGSGACAALWAYTFHSRVECYARDGSLRWSADRPSRIRPAADADPVSMSHEESFAYTDVFAWGGRVYALFVGRPAGEAGLKTDRLHVFSEQDGIFHGESLLPRPASYIARNDSLLALLEYSPIPAIYSYRIRDGD